jgi:hypothetical protein
MSILDQIETQWLSYIGETGRSAKYLFLGYKEIAELDKELGMITFRHKDMDVIRVDRESHVSCGNKYREDV